MSFVGSMLRGLRSSCEGVPRYWPLLSDMLELDIRLVTFSQYNILGSLSKFTQALTCKTTKPQRLVIREVPQRLVTSEEGMEVLHRLDVPESRVDRV